MLYYLSQFSDQFNALNLLRYLSFRSVGAVITALLFCFICGPAIIRWLRSRQEHGQPIREDGPESHLLTKKGTPTMGGVMILLATALSVLLWADLSNAYIWIILMVLFGFGALGFVDDYIKLTKRNSKGVSGKVKLVTQLVVSVVACVWIMSLSPVELGQHLTLPFLKDVAIDLGYFFIPFVAVVMVGSSNAVNLTDGLDGLAIVPVMIAALCFAVIAYLVGHVQFSAYLHIYHIPNVAEITVISAAVIGAGLGFLWFNAPPAQVFMGDTGSLALGGMLGAMSVMTKHEIVLAIIGGLFVIEALSVIIQVYYFKWSGGKRIFLMAPIHHHFEKKGWSESTIVIRFWIIAIIFALLGLATLKLR